MTNDDQLDKGWWYWQILSKVQGLGRMGGIGQCYRQYLPLPGVAHLDKFYQKHNNVDKRQRVTTTQNNDTYYPGLAVYQNNPEMTDLTYIGGAEKLNHRYNCGIHQGCQQHYPADEICSVWLKVTKSDYNRK